MAARKTPPRSPSHAKTTTAPLMREAVMRSLEHEAGKGSKIPRSRMVADALVDAAIKGEMAAVREVLRIDGKTAETRGGEERRGPSELRIRWLTEADEVPGTDKNLTGKNLTDKNLAGKIRAEKIHRNPKSPRS